MSSDKHEVTTSKIQTVREQMEKYKHLIIQSMPQYLDLPRITALFFTTLQRSPKLLDCTRESLFGALITATQLGLEVDSVTNQAHIIPYGDKATLIIGYKGLETLALRTKIVTRIVPRIVHDGDDFNYRFGLDPVLDHTPRHKSKDMSHVYAVAHLASGEQEFIVMDKEAVNKIRKRSKASADGPWVTDEAAMWCKTAIRQICKILPNISPETQAMHRAVAIEERLDAGLPQNLELEADPNAVIQPDPKDDQAPKRASGKAEGEPETKIKTPRDGMKKMETRFPGKCFDCATPITRGQTIWYNPDNKKAYCHEQCA